MFENQHLLLLGDIWWSEVSSLLKCSSFFSTPVLIRHLWQLKTVVFLHRCLICTLLLVSCHPRLIFIEYRDRLVTLICILLWSRESLCCLWLTNFLPILSFFVYICVTRLFLYRHWYKQVQQLSLLFPRINIANLENNPYFLVVPLIVNSQLIKFMELIT